MIKIKPFAEGKNWTRKRRQLRVRGKRWLGENAGQWARLKARGRNTWEMGKKGHSWAAVNWTSERQIFKMFCCGSVAKELKYLHLLWSFLWMLVSSLNVKLPWSGCQVPLLYWGYRQHNSVLWKTQNSEYWQVWDRDASLQCLHREARRKDRRGPETRNRGPREMLKTPTV